MDQGPVLVITFHAQQIMCVRDSKGALVEGDPVSRNFKLKIFLTLWKETVY